MDQRMTEHRGVRLRRGLGRSGLVLVSLVLGFICWLALGAPAEVDVLELALAGHAITVTDDGSVLTIAPAGGAAPDAVGVAFLPGTRVQPDAYVATWAPIVEATGVVVHIAAVPLNLPVLAQDGIDGIIAANPQTTTWIAGGHSMGGFVAAEYAALGEVRPAGLLLWASGPAETDLSQSDVPTLLVAGAADVVLPPDRIIDEASLPADTNAVIIDGMVHGQFGRYSDTEDLGDPTRRTDDETLEDLVAVTAGFVRAIADA